MRNESISNLIPDLAILGYNTPGSGGGGGGDENPTFESVTIASTLFQSQLHIYQNGGLTPSGFHLLGSYGPAAYLSAGGYFASTGWVADATEATVLQLDPTNNGLLITHNSGLTSGSNFSPTEIFRLDKTGVINCIGANFSSLTQNRAVVTDNLKNITSLQYTDLASAGTLMTRDGAKNTSLNNILLSGSIIPTAGATTTMTVASPANILFNGATTQTVIAPDVTTLKLFQKFTLTNLSTGSVTVNSSGGNLIQVMGANTKLVMECIAITGTTASSWTITYSNISTNSGLTNQLAYYASNGSIVSPLNTPSSSVLSSDGSSYLNWSTYIPSYNVPVDNKSLVSTNNLANFSIGSPVATQTSPNAIVYYTILNVSYCTVANYGSNTISTYQFINNNWVLYASPVATANLPISLSFQTIAGVNYLNVVTFGTNSYTTYQWSPNWVSLTTRPTNVDPTSIVSYAIGATNYSSVFNSQSGNITNYTFSGGTWTLLSTLTTTQYSKLLIKYIINGTDYLSSVNAYSGTISTWYWDGSAWISIGAPLSIPASDAATFYQIDNDSYISIVGASNLLITLKWNGTAWALFGTNISVSGNPQGITYFSSYGQSYVAVSFYASNFIYIYKRAANTWVYLTVSFTEVGPKAIITYVIDSNRYVSVCNYITGSITTIGIIQASIAAGPDYKTNVTSSTPLPLNILSARNQYFTGSTAQTVFAPDTIYLRNGIEYKYVNISSAVVTVNSYDGSLIRALAPNSILVSTCVSTAFNDASAWVSAYSIVDATTYTNLTVTNQITNNTGPSILNKDYGATGGSAFTLDPANGKSHRYSLNSNVTITLASVPAIPSEVEMIVQLTQGVSGNRAVTWANVTWATTGGVAPAINLAPGSSTFFFFKGDVNGWVGFAANQNIGITDGSNSAAGYIGEVVSSTLASGSAISLTSGTAANITSISLTPGDWMVSGNVGYLPATTITALAGGINSTSATLPTSPNDGCYYRLALAFTTGAEQVMPAGQFRVNITTTSTYYLVGWAAFSSTCTAYGSINARRLR